MMSMVNCKALLMLLVISSIASVAFAASSPLQRIVLQDKTVLVGRIVEMKNGVYSVQTETLGTINIDADKIVEITSSDRSSESPKIGIIDGSHQRPDTEEAKRPVQPAVQKSSPDSADLSQQQEEVNSQVRSMAMSGDFLDSMMNLSESSAMTDIMQDPEIMDAISRNDYEYLMNSEKMKNLMDSQEIKEMLGDVQP
ncbi:MAG: hypothetical protein PHD82_02160 [Candidatus Riflebacteria bacterium]|nr:hypothetical protein [Candidatus Riflebacteria bacterium]